MDKVKICLRNQKYEDTSLEVESMIESGGILTIVLRNYYADINENTIVSFIRCALYENETIPTLIQRYDVNPLTVNTIDETTKKTVITITAPDNYYFNVSAITEVNGIYKIDLMDTHYLFAQDIMSLNSDLEFYYRDINTGIEESIFKLNDISFYDYDKVIGYVIEPKYALFNIKPVETYNDCATANTIYELTPNFYYIDNSVNRKTIYTNTISVDNAKLFNGIYAPYNLFYRKNEYGVCTLWGDFEDYDTVADTIDEISGITTEYIPKNKEYVYSFADFVKDDNGLKISFGFTQNVDYKHMYQENAVRNLFTKKIKEAVVDNAPIIDMEKVKFAPYYVSGDTKLSISALTFNLHFRCREDLEESWRYVNEDYPIWNTIYDYSSITNGENEDEVNKSDMLYFLGFTDNDVQNQKAKIKKSFLRLSFYDSKDSLTQKLLYYSTIFMDSGELFGKYVKAKDELRRNGESTDNVVLNSKDSINNRLDCKFIVRDEYYTEKSSEGFNIYYFPSDVILSENSEKTIYMKVEFNHAGFGRTIPFIAVNNGQNNLSLDEYIDCLYIELKLKYIDGKYMYLVEDTDKTIDINNATITFNLFEPKLIK